MGAVSGSRRRDDAHWHRATPARTAIPRGDHALIGKELGAQAAWLDVVDGDTAVDDLLDTLPQGRVAFDSAAWVCICLVRSGGAPAPWRRTHSLLPEFEAFLRAEVERRDA